MIKLKHIILEDAPTGPPEVPKGLFAGPYGRFYKDKEHTQYAGKVFRGKWVPAKGNEVPSAKKPQPPTAPKTSSPAQHTPAPKPTEPTQQTSKEERADTGVNSIREKRVERRAKKQKFIKGMADILKNSMGESAPTRKEFVATITDMFKREKNRPPIKLTTNREKDSFGMYDPIGNEISISTALCVDIDNKLLKDFTPGDKSTFGTIIHESLHACSPRLDNTKYDPFVLYMWAGNRLTLSMEEGVTDTISRAITSELFPNVPWEQNAQGYVEFIELTTDLTEYGEVDLEELFYADQNKFKEILKEGERKYFQNAILELGGSEEQANKARELIQTMERDAGITIFFRKRSPFPTPMSPMTVSEYISLVLQVKEKSPEKYDQLTKSTNYLGNVIDMLNKIAAEFVKNQYDRPERKAKLANLKIPT